MSRALYTIAGLVLVSYACAPAHQAEPGARPTGADLVAEVQADYDADTDIPSLRDDNADLDTKYAVPDVDASSAKLKKKHWYTSSKHNWLAKIHVTAPYPPMKLATGDNYIFQVDNPTDAAHAFVIVPGDKSQPYFLLLSSANLAHGNPHKPLIIRKKAATVKVDEFVLGGCIECPFGHCSTSVAGDPYP